MANEEHLEILKQGVEVWNEWRHENRFKLLIPDLCHADLRGQNLCGVNFSSTDFNEADLRGADLSGADFSNTSTSLRRANLVRANLSGVNFNGMNLAKVNFLEVNLSTANLDQVELREANLSGANLYQTSLSSAKLLRADLSSANLEKAILWHVSLQGASLQEANLNGADLRFANLNGADFRKANLNKAILLGTQALATDFSNASFTGACLEDWHTNSSTNLDGVVCDYIYLKFAPYPNHSERLPHNERFAPGEFTKLFQEIENTIDLIFHNGINWRAFAIAFNQVNTQVLDTNQEGEIFLREYKVLGDGLIALKVTTPPGAVKANLRDELMIAYEKIASLEGELKAKNEILAPLYERLLLPDPQMSSNPQVRTILILSANPKGTSPLRLSEEVREIKEGLQRAKMRDHFSIVSAEAVRYRDIHRAILDHNPQIVHFCGHGAGGAGLVFEDETGLAKLIDAKALADLFEQFAEQVECVVLNACYSQEQAKAIRQKIGYVVGMSKEIGDNAAIEFAVGFYDALGAGKPIDFAHRLGCNLIQLAGIPEHLTPKLLVNPTLKRTTIKRELTSTELELDQEAANQVKAVSQEPINLSLEAEKLKFNNIRSQAQYNLELAMKRAELEGFLTSMYGKPININKANSTKIVNKFPGITQTEAKAIVNNRPDGGYRSFEELVKLNKSECPNASWDIIKYLVVFE
jgi:uncharacterized protein YjbI with pentapeptide repeats/DNA uptake protein ComE-like DNA-binding protein